MITWGASGWLWLLLPWAGLVVLCLRSYRPKVTVPFLDLWPRDQPQPDRRRGWRPPGLVVLLLLLAMLAGILATGEPKRMLARPVLPRVTVILDRGAAMRAAGRDRDASAEAIELLNPFVDEQTTVHVMDTVGGDLVMGWDRLSATSNSSGEAGSIRYAIKPMVERALRENEGLVVVISDQPATVEPIARVLQVVPRKPVQNVGIRGISVAGDRLLVRLLNDSSRREATLRSGGLTQVVQLGPRGDETVAELPNTQRATVTIELLEADDIADDNRAAVMVEPWGARLLVGDTATEIVRKFAASYAKARRPVNEVVVSLADASGHAVIVVGDGEERSVDWPMAVADHDLLRDVQCSGRARVSRAGLPPGQWRVLAGEGELPLVAVDEGARRVWIGFVPAESSADGAMVADYLLLLTNSVDYTKGAISPAPPVAAALAGDARPRDRMAQLEQIAGFAEGLSQVGLAPWLWMAAVFLATGGAVAGWRKM